MVWPWPFHDHLDHSIVVFKNDKRCLLAGDEGVWILSAMSDVHFLAWDFSPLEALTHPLPYSTEWAQEFCSILNLRLMRYFLLQCCCVQQLFAS